MHVIVESLCVEVVRVDMCFVSGSSLPKRSLKSLGALNAAPSLKVVRRKRNVRDRTLVDIHCARLYYVRSRVLWRCKRSLSIPAHTRARVRLTQWRKPVFVRLERIELSTVAF